MNDSTHAAIPRQPTGWLDLALAEQRAGVRCLHSRPRHRCEICKWEACRSNQAMTDVVYLESEGRYDEARAVAEANRRAEREYEELVRGEVEAARLARAEAYKARVCAGPGAAWYRPRAPRRHRRSSGARARAGDSSDGEPPAPAAGRPTAAPNAQVRP